MLRIAEKSSLILDNLPSPYYARKGCINSEDYKTFVSLIRIILHHYIILFHNTFPQELLTFIPQITPPFYTTMWKTIENKCIFIKVFKTLFLTFCVSDYTVSMIFNE